MKSPAECEQARILILKGLRVKLDGMLRDQTIASAFQLRKLLGRRYEQVRG
jgi:hypothetical protein